MTQAAFIIKRLKNEDDFVFKWPATLSSLSEECLAQEWLQKPAECILNPDPRGVVIFEKNVVGTWFERNLK